MNGGRSDASTSTDDVKGRPLCLFYFTHPFGVLSPEPPTITTAPPHITRAFLNMEPVSPFYFWSSPTEESYQTDSTTSASGEPAFDQGNVTTQETPVGLVSVARTRKCTLDFGSRRDSICSSLFSGDVWYDTSSSSRSNDRARKMIPYNRILPPLRLPSPKDMSDFSSDDLWPRRCLNPEKFSLPPIEMPVLRLEMLGSKTNRAIEGISSVECVSTREAKNRRRIGVKKEKRNVKLGDVRRMVACLMRRAIKGGKGARSGRSPALRAALRTVREAWVESSALRDRCRAETTPASSVYIGEDACGQNGERGSVGGAMRERADLAELPPRAGASPGLLRRRYSVPETIMRKYRLAQQGSDSEENGFTTNYSVASASPLPDSYDTPPHRFLRRDRELMRKSALLRRMWGRPCNPTTTCCCCGDTRETRSLDGSHSELRPLSGSFGSSRHSNAAAAATGWATPKRQRLDNFHTDDIAASNVFDRNEGSRPYRTTGTAYSGSTYRSHGREMFSRIETITDAFTDSDALKLENGSETNASPRYSDRPSSDVPTVEIESDGTPGEIDSSVLLAAVDDRSFTDTSDSFSTSMTTAKETNGSERRRCEQISRSGHIDGRISERSMSVENEDRNILPYDRLLTVETPSYEVLEIVVSETSNTESLPAIGAQISEKFPRHALNATAAPRKCTQNINIDEYVSNILVESLNSLTDQLECMNASIGSDRKINIVEKEIKVKLQNTGVNTIVHLSPTSNNQIIFGNEELCNNGDIKDSCNNLRDLRNSATVREELHSVEYKNNLTPDSPHERGNLASEYRYASDGFENVVQHDNVNKAVLQQIQKLFQDELHNLDPDVNYPGNAMPGISHIEISNVDVYINNNTDPVNGSTDAIEMHTRRNDNSEMISGVGAGNYFQDADENAVVPRFSAFPHTESMEVNTSSSDDAEMIGSDCTSLVDSLDDPNSPRSILLRRSLNNKRSDLVRSAIDVLDLLPENANDNENSQPRDKGESFFIRIKDDDCDCEKENVKVADHMPEKIRQRLFRRHRKRELRMECARRSKVKQLRRELEKKRYDDMCKSKREIEKECMAIINALIDDVIAKIAQDEYKYMRIKQRPNKVTAAKSDENLSKRNKKKDVERIEDPFKVSENSGTHCCANDSIQDKKKCERHKIHSKLSLLTRPALISNGRGPKRIYQKSEIHEGDKCIEILEILEYVNGSQTSPENSNSDESHHTLKTKKSRIPVPVYERIQGSSKHGTQKCHKGSDSERASPILPRERKNGKSTIANMLLEAFGERSRTVQQVPERRASVPHCEPRSRSNSLRFRRVFDIIPEEKSSLSFDSSSEDGDRLRRASAPDVVAAPTASSAPAPAPAPLQRARGKPRDVRSAATSPFADDEGEDHPRTLRSQTTMTSPGSKSAATSPLRAATRGRGCLAREGSEEAVVRESDGAGECRTVPARCDRSRDPHRAFRSRRADFAGQANTRTDRICENPKDRKRESKRKKDGPQRDATETRQPGSSESIGAGGDPARSLAEAEAANRKTNSRAKKTVSGERSSDRVSGESSTRLPECRGSSSDSGDSSGLLCSLAPRWLTAHARQRRAARPRDAPAPSSPPSPPLPDPNTTGAWSVTVAGSCRAALPSDVEMRLRFPHDHGPQPHPQERVAHMYARAPSHSSVDTCTSANYQECTCPHCVACARSTQRAALPAAPPREPLAAPPPAARAGRLTLAMKKEALDSSILASKSSKKSTEQLPDLETYRASRTKLKSSLKTRRRYSLHCWLPEDERAPIRINNGLSVLGCAIIPELKPRVPTMSERDLTRVYTPRHYLRS